MSLKCRSGRRGSVLGCGWPWKHANTHGGFLHSASRATKKKRLDGGRSTSGRQVSRPMGTLARQLVCMRLRSKEGRKAGARWIGRSEESARRQAHWSVAFSTARMRSRPYGRCATSGGDASAAPSQRWLPPANLPGGRRLGGHGAPLWRARGRAGVCPRACRATKIGPHDYVAIAIGASCDRSAARAEGGGAEAPRIAACNHRAGRRGWPSPLAFPFRCAQQAAADRPDSCDTSAVLRAGSGRLRTHDAPPTIPAARFAAPSATDTAHNSYVYSGAAAAIIDHMRLAMSPAGQPRRQIPARPALAVRSSGGDDGEHDGAAAGGDGASCEAVRRRAGAYRSPRTVLADGPLVSRP